MMKMKNAENIARKLRTELERYKSFVGLYLYGSYTKGTATANSDIDIVAVFNNSREHKKAILKAWDIEVDNDVVIDFHPFVIKNLQKDSLYFNEVKKGIYFGREESIQTDNKKLVG